MQIRLQDALSLGANQDDRKARRCCAEGERAARTQPLRDQSVILEVADLVPEWAEVVVAAVEGDDRLTASPMFSVRWQAISCPWQVQVSSVDLKIGAYRF